MATSEKKFNKNNQKMDGFLSMRPYYVTLLTALAL